MQIKAEYQRFLFSTVLLFFIFWFGRLSVQYQLHRELPPVQSMNEMNPTIPLIEITNIQNAVISGKVNRPEARIVSGEQVAVPDENGEFQLDIQHLGYSGEKRPVILHQVPEWAQFVASKKGKYFYAIDEKSAKKLSVPNRIYFSTAEEAIAAGYLQRER